MAACEKRKGELAGILYNLVSRTGLMTFDKLYLWFLRNKDIEKVARERETERDTCDFE